MWLSAFGPIHKNVGGENYGLSSLDYLVLSAELGESLFRHNVAEAILKSFRSVDTNTQSTQKKKPMIIRLPPQPSRAHLPDTNLPPLSHFLHAMSAV